MAPWREKAFSSAALGIWWPITSSTQVPKRGKARASGRKVGRGIRKRGNAGPEGKRKQGRASGREGGEGEREGAGLEREARIEARGRKGVMSVLVVGGEMVWREVGLVA